MKRLILLFLFIVLSSLTACQLKENYAMQSSFTNEVIIENKVTPRADGLSLEVGFADFSCDITSFGPVLSRSGNSFKVILEGNETIKRCSQKFSANITGIQPGEYWISVIYKKADQEQQVLYEQLTISK